MTINNENSNELREYLVEQIIEYVQAQTNNHAVTAKKIIALETEVSHICGIAFPDQVEHLSQQASKIVRAVLDTHQMDLTHKIKRFVDHATKSKDSVVSSMMTDIIKIKSSAPTVPSIKNSWVAKIKEERANKITKNISQNL